MASVTEGMCSIKKYEEENRILSNSMTSEGDFKFFPT